MKYLNVVDVEILGGSMALLCYLKQIKLPF